MINVIRVFRSLGIARVIAFGIGSGLLLAACGGSGSGSGSGSSSGSGIEGTYFFQMGDAPGEGITLELKDDGIAVSSWPEQTGVPAVQGRHTMEGDKLIVLLNNDRDVYTVGADGTLTTIEMGEEWVGVKQ